MVSIFDAGAVLLALLLDGWLGEPRRWHPLAGFGLAAQTTERWLHPGKRKTGRWAGRLRGTLALLPLVVLPATLLALWLPKGAIGFLPAVLLLYFSIGARSLTEHGQAVVTAWQTSGITAARQRVGMMVSRDTQGLDERETATATLESILENGCDAVFAPLFWFLVAGAPGAVVYRLVNTLDAMWGYKTPRYRHFGWAAARCDDLLNAAPARLTALTYALLGKTRTALRCWRQQAPSWKSHNAGTVMAAGAGTLAVQLGGAAHYHGTLTQRPPLGLGRPPTLADIATALRLLRNGVWLWALLVLVLWRLGYA